MFLQIRECSLFQRFVALEKALLPHQVKLETSGQLETPKLPLSLNVSVQGIFTRVLESYQQTLPCCFGYKGDNYIWMEKSLFMSLLFINAFLLMA